MRRLMIAFLLAAGLPSTAIGADRVVVLATGNPMAGSIRLGSAKGGPTLHDVVPADVAAKVFKSKSDSSEFANAWFARSYGAALRVNGFLAEKPEQARYELSADVVSMAITPLETGAHHKSVVTYRLREIATNRLVWEQTQAMDFDVKRGPAYGKMAGTVVFAVASAMLGVPPTFNSLTSFNQRRPFDTRMDVYQSILRGFEKMADESMKGLWFNSQVDPTSGAPVEVARANAPDPEKAIITQPAINATPAASYPPIQAQTKAKPTRPREDVIEVIL